MMSKSAVFSAVALVVLMCLQNATSLTDVCSMPRHTGPCFANMPRFYYDQTKGACSSFNFGGCRGNENNFKTMAECRRTCAAPTDVCAMPSVTGPCRANMPRFYYDPTEGACSSFTFGGCRGNENNFKTMAECRRTCAGPKPLNGRCPQALCKCPRGVPITTSIDSNGCEICSCEPRRPCGPVCMIFCPFGNVLDARGCPTCTCNTSKPKPRCPPVCTIFCPNGNVMDKNGCPTCTCKPKPRCPPVCKIFCPNGNVMDNNGCPTCECKPRNQVCPMVRCSEPCPQGFTKDSRGCQTCSCKPLSRECPLVKCANRCRRGYEKDLRGCQTCECKPAECPVFRCRACPTGYEKDSNGCDTCRCKPRSCPTALCNFYCMVPQFFSARMRDCGCNCGRQGRQLSRQ